MMNNPYGYAISGGEMRGRKRLAQQLLSALEAETPAHVKVVGPKLAGKTVFMQSVSGALSETNAYLASCYWDLRRNTPKSDSDFRRQLANVISDHLADSDEADLVPELRVPDEQLGSAIGLVLDYLADSGHRIAVFMDNFDALQIGTDISPNLLDNLLAFGNKASFWIVTASRRPLLELCNTEESATSDFWEAFLPTPLTLGPLEEDDWVEIVQPFSDRGSSFEPKAMHKLRQWTGGTPVLVAQVLRHIWDATQAGQTIGVAEIDAAAESLLRQSRSLLDRLWHDCSEDTRSDIRQLASGPFKASQVTHTRREALLERGYAQQEGKQLKSSCELVARYASEEHRDAQSLYRAFGEADRYAENLPKLLELRLSQVPHLDAKLRKLALEPIHHLSDTPELAVNRVRAFVQRALNLVFTKELDGKDEIPSDWIAEWKYNNRLPTNENVQRRGILPGDAVDLLYVLRLAVAAQSSDGGKWNIRRKAKFVSKQSYYLLSHLHGVGNLGQHLKDEDVSTAFAFSVCFTVVGLCETLSSELSASSVD